MGRLGARQPSTEICRAIEEASDVQLEGLMTHFASAADYASSQTEEQMRTFETICGEIAAQGISPAYLHESSTIPVAYGRKAAWKKMVRPGHAIYGYVSPVSKGTAPPQLLNVKPALTWKASILAIKDIPAGARVGYGAIFRAPQPMKIGVLAAGYADGIPHRLSNRGKVIAGGKPAAILGAVSMDLTTIDISASPQLKVGDSVILLGSEGGVSIDAQQMARTAGTISYSVLCGISARVKRIYV
jgi:alanine racemase